MPLPPGRVSTIATRTAAIDENTVGTHEIVAAETGFDIVVDSIVITCAAANTITWEDGTGPISGPMSFAANGGYSLDGGNLLETAQDSPLQLTLASAQQVSGHISYHLEVH